MTNFNPRQTTMTFAVGTASAAAAQTITQTLGSSLNAQPIYDLRVFNDANGTCFVQWGGTAVVATTTTGYPIPSGGVEIINMGFAAHGASVIMGTGTGAVYVTPGGGS